MRTGVEIKSWFEENINVTKPLSFISLDLQTKPVMSATAGIK